MHPAGASGYDRTTTARDASSERHAPEPPRSDDRRPAPPTTVKTVRRTTSPTRSPLLLIAAAIGCAVGVAGRTAHADSSTMRPLQTPSSPDSAAPPAATAAAPAAATLGSAAASSAPSLTDSRPTDRPQGTDRPSASGRLLPSEGRVDHLAMTDSADSFDAGTYDATAWRDAAVRPVGEIPAALTGSPADAATPGAAAPLARLGSWSSPVTPTPFPALNVLPSWNVDAPDGSGVRFDVRVRQPADGATGDGAGGPAGMSAADGWSPWLYLGSWGEVPRPDGARAAGGERVKRDDAASAKADATAAPDGSAAPDPAGPHVRRFEGGRVHIDVLTLDRPADAYQVRATFYAAPGAAGVASLRRVTVVTSGLVADLPDSADAEAQAAADVAASPDLPAAVAPGWSGTLDVPFLAQRSAVDVEVGGEVCSPTSTTMVMAYQGVPLPLEQNYRAILDPDTGIYGNWNRAVARAGQLGLDAWLRRFRSFDEVRAELAAGRPVIASIRFGTGEFPSNVLKKTDGHLIVIRGFTPDGDAVVNDPASPSRGEGVVYKADELSRAWLDHGGVGYVIRRPADD